MRHGCCILLALFAIQFSTVQAVPPVPQNGPATSEELAAGQALAERVRSSAPQEDSQISGTLIITSPSGEMEVPILCKVAVTPTNWVTDYQTAATAQIGAQQLVIAHTSNGPEQYFYAAAPSPAAPLPTLKAIPPDDAAIPLAGSDFSLGDLGLEYLYWPIQRQLKGEMRLGEPCYVLESMNPQGGEIVRIKSYIDKEYMAPLIVAGYDENDHLVKEFSLHGSSFKKINGRWQMEKMDIRNKKTSSHTTLKFDLK